MKKIFSIALCAVLAAGSVVGANAAGIKQNKAVKVLSETTRVNKNRLVVYTYNVSPDSKNGVVFIGGNTEKEYSVNFADCINNRKIVQIPSTELYTRYLSMDNGKSGNTYPSYSFANTAGDYVKVRVKLSEVDPSYFNEDGSHTQQAPLIEGYYHDFKFKYEEISGSEYYNSAMYFQSGAVVTGVVPDKDGCVEIYISTNVSDMCDFCTDFSYQVSVGGYSHSGGGGGTSGNYVPALNFGNIDLKGTVNVNDVTALQLYLAGTQKLDSLQIFYADVNRDKRRDVRDVTALQNAIAD